jgi:spore maturation protein CgeB
VDISLVGKLYQTEYPYFTAPLDDYLKGYLNGIVSSQMKIYGGYIIPELVTDELLDRMNKIYRSVAKDDFRMGRRELEFMLACETTGRERYMILSLLSNHYAVDLYSNNTDDRLTNVRYRGYADYETQLPCIFASSRINLNISLKAIRTGIPLRVIEILGCGGFVMTNYQEEIAEYLSVGEECVVYENIEDLYAKVSYYLEHEEERGRIAAAGLERAKRDFTFEDRLRRMLLSGD